jgi:hypothetical protein
MLRGRREGLGIRGNENNSVQALRFEKLQSIKNIIEVRVRLLDETDYRSFVAVRVVGGEGEWQLSQVELEESEIVCLSQDAIVCLSLCVGITGWKDGRLIIVFIRSGEPEVRGIRLSS